MSNDDKLIPAEVVADYYGVDPKTAARWAKSGRIPGPVVQRKGFTRWSRNAVVADVERIKSEAMAEAAS